jgi:hypothetical protein
LRGVAARGELVLPGLELLWVEELESVRAEPLRDVELPWVAANATPPPPINDSTAAAVARVVRLNTRNLLSSDCAFDPTSGCWERRERSLRGQPESPKATGSDL